MSIRFVDLSDVRGPACAFLDEINGQFLYYFDSRDDSSSCVFRSSEQVEMTSSERRGARDAVPPGFWLRPWEGNLVSLGTWLNDRGGDPAALLDQAFKQGVFIRDQRS